MNILQNYSIKNLNTLGLDISTDYFVSINTLDDLKLIRNDSDLSNLPLLILGGGSNVIFTGNYHGLIAYVNLKGREIVNENDKQVELKIAGGENWHETVLFSVEQGWWGIENLSLIPGTVGAAPIQNIGAYGVELCDVFQELEALNLSTGEMQVFDKKDCEFDYRNSVFKSKYSGEYLITSVTLVLNKKPSPVLTYSDLEKGLSDFQKDKLSAKIVSAEVCRIRQEKLPDPAVIGNAGSFFQNPVVNEEQFNLLIKKYPELRYFKSGNLQNPLYKLAAAWLIDQCGWKGRRLGDAGVHDKHALVLINLGNAKPEEILQLAENISTSVKEKFNIDLVKEPVLINSR